MRPTASRFDLRRGAALAFAAVLFAFLAVGRPSAQGEVTCTKYAAAAGSNSNPGTREQPYRTAGHLVGKLQPGDIGCLRAGTFTESVAVRSGGSPGHPVTLTSAPGELATLKGTLSISDTANDVVISNLVLNGTNSSSHPSPIVNGDRVTLRDNDITNEHTAICVLLGPGFENEPERATDAVVQGNRIHNCGRLPATGHDHGIYVEGTRNAQITDNVIYDNADYGIHLYPDGDGSYVGNNVVDGNGGGLIFAGEDDGGEYASSHASDHNLVQNNIFSNNTRRNNIESWWGGPTGIGNIARFNCVWNGLPANINASDGGFAHDSNVVADPQYVARAGKDFRLKPGSPCTGKEPRSQVPPPPPPVSPRAPPAPVPPASPDARAIRIGISPRFLTATARGVVAVRIGNPAAAGGTLRGRITLEARLRASLLGGRGTKLRRLRLGSSGFALAPGRSRVVRVKLSSSTRRVLRRARTLRARALAKGRDATGAQRSGVRTVLVRARKARRR